MKKNKTSNNNPLLLQNRCACITYCLTMLFLSIYFIKIILGQPQNISQFIFSIFFFLLNGLTLIKIHIAVPDSLSYGICVVGSFLSLFCITFFLVGVLASIIILIPFLGCIVSYSNIKLELTALFFTICTVILIITHQN